MPPQIFIGTQNPKKLNEIQQILGGRYALLSFQDFPMEEVQETEPTLEGNAKLKALHYFRQTQMPCLADDTGLEVEALGGKPGVYSARYAGEPADSQQNIQKLLRELNAQNAFSPEQRKAQFRTVIAFYDGRALHTFEGILQGHIALEPFGNQGFGYDPIFIPEGYSQTLAQMPPEQKNAISHRSIALHKLKKFLETYP